MKKLIYLVLILFCLFSPLQAQDVILPFSKILSWLDADSIHCRVFYADSIIAGVVITDYSYLSADSIITASFTVWDTTTGFKFVDFQGVQRKAFIDSLGVRELTVTDSAYIDTLTIEVLNVLGKAIIDDSLRNNGTFRQFLTATFGATATPVTISTTGDITAAGKMIIEDSLNVGDSLIVASPYFIGVEIGSNKFATHTVQSGLAVTVPSDEYYLAAFYSNDISLTDPVFSYYANNSYLSGFDSGDFLMGTNAAKRLSFYTNSDANPRMTILGTGFTGVNTISPLNLFEVKGNKLADTLLHVYNDKSGRDSSFSVLPTGGIAATGTSTFGATATPVEISTNGKVTAADTIRTNTGLKVGNPTVADQQNVSIILTVDADTDAGGTTKERLTITSSGNATPTNQKWAFTGTQGSGYSFDKHIYMAPGKEIGFTPSSVSSIRFNDGGVGGGYLSLNTANTIGSSNGTSGVQFANTTLVSKSSGTASLSALNIPYTINLDAAVSSGIMYGIFTNATETNLRGLGHYLMDLQVGSVTQFRVTNSGTGYFAGNLGIGTTAPVKKLHVKGDVAIGDTATATNERFLYFAGDGNTMQHNIKHINTGTGFSGFYFSDSISADGYIDYCEYYEGNALNAVASVEKELGSSSKQGFAKLNHNSLPTGVRTTFDLSYWKRKSDNLRMHDGFKPVMSIDPVWIVTPDTSYWQQPTDEDKINYVGNFNLVKEPKPGRNISRMVSLLTKAVQELQAENTLLKKRLDKLEKP